jgi:hypothetical protein
MESLIDLIIEAFQILDAAFDFDGIWDFRKVFPIGLVCFLYLFNSYILGSISAPLYYSAVLPPCLERALGAVRESIGVNSRRLSLLRLFSLMGHHSIGPLSLSMRINS